MSVDDTEEQWRPVVGWEDLYEVSSHGRVRSLHKRGRATGGILAANANSSAYPMVGLCRAGVRTGRKVHSLVAEAFIGPRPDGMEICHRDGNSKNNRAENLRYGSRSENIQDTVTHGTHAQASKTHCLRGHELTESNTYRSKARPNARWCRKCVAERQKLPRADYSAADGLITRRDAADLLGIKAASIYNLLRQNPDFPKPSRIRGRVFWDPEELRAWREQHPPRRQH